MAIYTEIRSNELNQILRLYGLERPRDVRGILDGTVNTYYELSYPEMKLLLKVDEVGHRGRLKNELRVMEKLGSRCSHIGVSFPKPIRTKRGRTFISFKKKFVLLFEKLNGRSIPMRGLKAGHLDQIGKKLALLHIKTKGIQGISPHRFTQHEMHKVYTQIRGKLDRRHPAVGLEVKQWMARLKKKSPAGLPSGIIHADLFPENILFTKDRLTGIVDFEAAGYGPFIFDIAVTLHACCHTGSSFDRARIKHLLAGYVSKRPITPIEWKSFEYFLFESALRFLLTRLRDFELKRGLIKAAPFKDYKEYLRRFSEIPELVGFLGSIAKA